MYFYRISGFIACLFLCLASFFIPTLATAQSSGSTNAQQLTGDLDALMESAREKGLSVIVISPKDEEAKIVETGPGLADQALTIRTELARIFAQAGEAPAIIWQRFHQLSPDGTLNWLWIAIATAVGSIAVGTIPSIFTSKLSKSHFKSIYNPDPGSRAEKIQYLLFRAFIILLNISILALVAGIIALVFDTGHQPSRVTISVIVGGYIAYKIIRHVILFNLIAPDTPSHRMINLEDQAANIMQRQWRRAAFFVIVISSFFVWLAFIGLRADTLKLVVMVCLLISAIIFATLAYHHRHYMRSIILGAGEPSAKPVWRRILASQAWLLIVLYLVIAWCVSVYRIILNLPDSLSIIGSPVIALIMAITLYAVAILLIDKFYTARQKRYEERVRLAHEKAKQRQSQEQANLQATLQTSDEDDDIRDDMIINDVMKAKQLETMPVFKPIFKTLIESAAGIIVTIFALGWILSKWDVNIGESGNPVTEFLDTLLIIFIAWFLYRAVILYIDNQLAEQDVGASPDNAAGDSEMGGQSTSRMGTLLPLVRNVFIVTIIVLAIMVILSNAGVDIAPLFAGAGVIGLAVGFGSQALIRDIFSGGFFLFDDAFRKGEYVELGDIRGTVEKISLRSFQLRHHNGPLHTIPFGEIKQLTNYSRDWVMMKLPLRLTYDTDVERVRKLIKKLGQQLLEHKECGHLFLQPLKSQGVYKMEDSAMIIRVKFMTKPGDQFVTRKVVYAAIRDLFEREGIKFANKEVTVRLAEEPVEPLSDHQKQAITAATRSVIDEEALASSPDHKKNDL